MSWKVTKIKTCEVDDDNSIDFVCDSDGLRLVHLLFIVQLMILFLLHG